MRSAASPASASAAGSAARCWSKRCRDADLGEHMERVEAGALLKHWRWEKDRDGLVWLTFDKQGESANTFSRDALHELAAALGAIRLDNPKGLVIRSAKAGFIA